jgi:signal transduction histidine kinase
VIRDAFAQLLAEPGVPNAPGPMRRDWVLVGIVVVAATVEIAVRTDLGWPPLGFVMAVLPAFLLPWRRTRPLGVVAVGFAAHGISELTTLFGPQKSSMLYVTAFLLLLPYALARWASGRHVAFGVVVILVPHVPQGPITRAKVLETIFGILFLLLPAELGAVVRYRTTARHRTLEQVKLRERELLARDLHDTVAHHVSAIIIQAQAGRAVAAADPGAAVRTLEVIEAEASRTLHEMRTMVGALRQGEAADLRPQQGVADIVRLAGGTGATPRVDVRLSGGLDDLPPSIGAAVYRLAQESITNAVRHARHATHIDVSVAGDADCVRLTVCDDGEPVSVAATSPGYGLVGMSERAKLLGGTLEAGPSPGRGWTITAVLPLRGVPA